MAKRVEIKEKKIAFQKAIFQIDEAHLRYEKYNGQMSDEIVRLNLNRGDSAAALVYRTTDDRLAFTEQFRFSTYEKGPGWILEIPAGIVEQGEKPEVAMRRELVEEIGYEVGSLHHINTFYLSPGGTSERIFLFYAEVTPQQKTKAGGGLVEEAEDIRTVFYTVDEALKKMQNGEILDAKSLIALQWLQLKRLNKK